MFRAKFTYNEPMIGDIEIDGKDLSLDDIVKYIEQSYPEAIDIELLEVEEFNV